MFGIQNILEARERIAPYIIETPMIRLANLDEYLGCEVWIKAENMQKTGAFKLRGALNRTLSLTKEELAGGVVCASSGNHGKGVAYTAKMLGIPATVVIPDSAPKVKVEAIRALGAEIVQCETAERFNVAARIAEEKGAVILPPYNDEYIMAGQGTCGLEIAEQAPDVDAVVVPVSGGGLISGVATAVKEKIPSAKVYGAEPAVLPRYSKSLAAGERIQVESVKTVADALVTNMPGEKCFPVVQKYVDRVVDVPEEDILRGTKLLLLEGKILAEPSSCIGIAAVLAGLLKFDKEDKVCFVVSGGSVGISQLALLEDVVI